MKKNVYSYGSAGFGVYAFDSETFGLEPTPDTRAEATLIPGFVDIHIHGAFGIDFMAASREEMLALCEKLVEVGYEAFLPTTITASVADISRALSILPEHRMIQGFHLEGPFISPLHPGAQPPQAIVDPPVGSSEWDAILDDPRLRVITLAPERPGALELTERLSSRGVRVSFGHTDATYAQCREGFEAGGRHSTHTYNAMRPLHHREPGTVGFTFVEDGQYAELIYDRHHVAREAAEVLVRMKPADKLLAISDAAMAAGLAAGTELKMWGLECVIGEGTVRLKSGSLAGSAITLLDAFRNLFADFGPETAIRACCLNPRQVLGMDPLHPKMYVELDDELSIVEKFHRN